MRLPLKLKIRDGLKWAGSLTIFEKDSSSYVVGFDAEILDPAVEFRHVYDRTVLTARQLEDWTGFREDESHVATTTRRMRMRTP